MTETNPYGLPASTPKRVPPRGYAGATHVRLMGDADWVVMTPTGRRAIAKSNSAKTKMLSIYQAWLNKHQPQGVSVRVWHTDRAYGHLFAVTKDGWLLPDGDSSMRQLDLVAQGWAETVEYALNNPGFE